MQLVARDARGSSNPHQGQCTSPSQLFLTKFYFDKTLWFRLEGSVPFFFFFGNAYIGCRLQNNSHEYSFTICQQPSMLLNVIRQLLGSVGGLAASIRLLAYRWQQQKMSPSPQQLQPHSAEHQLPHLAGGPLGTGWGHGLLPHCSCQHDFLYLLAPFTRTLKMKLSVNYMYMWPRRSVPSVLLIGFTRRDAP